MNKSKTLVAEIDKRITESFGPSAKKTNEWFSDSELNFSITFQVDSISIEVWRDRGLYSVLVARKNSSKFYSIEKIANFLGRKEGLNLTVSSPKDLTTPLEFLKRMSSEIENILLKPNIDKELNESFSVNSIARSDRKA